MSLGFGLVLLVSTLEVQVWSFDHPGIGTWEEGMVQCFPCWMEGQRHSLQLAVIENRVPTRICDPLTVSLARTFFLSWNAEETLVFCGRYTSI